MNANWMDHGDYDNYWNSYAMWIECQSIDHFLLFASFSAEHFLQRREDRLSS
jgi:hypothetical protein